MPSSVQSPRLSKRLRGLSPKRSNEKIDSNPPPGAECHRRITRSQPIPISSNLPLLTLPPPSPAPAPVSATPPRKRVIETEVVRVTEGGTVPAIPPVEVSDQTASPVPVARSLFGSPNTAILRQHIIKSWEASTVRFRKRWNFDPDTGLPCPDPQHRHRYLWTKVLHSPLDNGITPIVPPSPRRERGSAKLSSFQPHSEQAANQSHHRDDDIISSGCQTPPTAKKFNASPLTQRSIKDYMKTKKGTSAHPETKKKPAH